MFVEFDLISGCKLRTAYFVLVVFEFVIHFGKNIGRVFAQFFVQKFEFVPKIPRWNVSFFRKVPIGILFLEDRYGFDSEILHQIEFVFGPHTYAVALFETQRKITIARIPIR